MGKQGISLIDDPSVWSGQADSSPIHKDCSCRGTFLAKNHTQQGRFTATGLGPTTVQNSPWLHGQINIIKDHFTAIAFPHILQIEEIVIIPPLPCSLLMTCLGVVPGKKPVYQLAQEEIGSIGKHCNPQDIDNNDIH